MLPFFVFLFLSCLCLSTWANSSIDNNNIVITDYHQIFIPCYDKNGNLLIAIRMYFIGATPYYLVVNPYTFATESAPAANFKNRNISSKGNTTPGYYTWDQIKNTPYMKVLFRYTSGPYPMNNYGVTHAEHAVNGEFLTVDMCPSAKPFEEQFFKALVAIANRNHQPVPLAISLTGIWMIEHPKEFNWLTQQEKANTLQITWTNHTFSHLYYPDLPINQNFLLTTESNITHEILDTEKMLLEKHQLPSVFFRFPGLVSNKKLVLMMRHFGLIPIASNAWLAKGQQAKIGSIILVHGNSNEPQGIKDFMPMLQYSNLNLLPLSKAF